MQSRVYNFLLDYFPLTDVVMQENPVLGQELQQTGIDVLYESVAGLSTLERLERLRLLLRLAYDLGYLDEDVERYLGKALRDIVDGL